MFLLRDKLIMEGEKRETSTQTCNETMLRAKLRFFVSRIEILLFASVGFVTYYSILSTGGGVIPAYCGAFSAAVTHRSRENRVTRMTRLAFILYFE